MGEITIRLGRAGAGKSTQIAREIADEVEREGFGSPIYWVVPSQAAYSTERLLLKHAPSSIRAEVIHLDRLVQRASTAIGFEMGSAINTMGRRMLLASVYQKVKSNLQVFHRIHPSLNFFDSILRIFTEMAEHQISLDQLESALEVASTGLSVNTSDAEASAGRSLLGKLRDLCTLYYYWKQEMRTRGLYDSEELMTMVESRLKAWRELASCTFYIDGYSDMTPQEISFVLALAKHAKKTVITICADPSWVSEIDQLNTMELTSQGNGFYSLQSLLSRIANPDEVFAPQTLLLLHQLVAKCRTEHLALQIDTWTHEKLYRFEKAPPLMQLQQNLFGGPVTNTPPADSIHLVASQNIKQEVDWCLQQILKVVRELKVPFESIAVIATNLETYRPYLRERFAHYEIPFHVEEFPSLSTHPLPKFLLTAIDCIQTDYGLDAMLRLIKSDFSRISLDDADWFERYLTNHEIAGQNTWSSYEEWSFAFDSRGDWDNSDTCHEVDRKANDLRKRIMSYLLPWSDALKFEKLKPQTLGLALWNLILATDAKRTVAEWMVNADVEQSPIEASIHEQAWQRVVELMNDLHGIETPDELPVSFLFELVQGDIIKETLSTIPAGVSEVVITDATRTVGWDADVVFILGTVDNAFPRRSQNATLLRDDERVQFARLFGIRLGNTSEDLQLSERLTLYSSLTRARRRIYMSRPLANGTGKKVSPAFVVQRIQTLFPLMTSELYLPGIKSSVENGNIEIPLYTVRQAVEYLVTTLSHTQASGRLPGVLLPIWDWLCENHTTVDVLDKAVRGLRHRTLAEPLPKEIAERLYGDPMRTNVHQLESFAACSYQHFVKFGLRIQRESTPDVTPAVRGTLKHDVLLEFVQEQMKRIHEWKQLTDDDAIQVMRQIFNNILHQPKSTMWRRKHARYEYAQSVLHELENAAIVLTRHARHGMFEPAAIEFSFGDKSDDRLTSYSVDLGDGRQVYLRGRIDRVDVATTDGRHAFRIVDYKSSQMKIDLTKVANGLRLQLPLYAAVVEHNSSNLFGVQSEPAGMVYIPIVHKVELTDVPMDHGDAKEAVYQNMKASGLFVEDKTLVEWMDSRLVHPPLKSDLFPQIYKQDGSLLGRAPVLSTQEWKAVMGRALAHVKEISERILQGETSIAPYWSSSTDRACTFCDFASLCHFDRKHDGNLYRRVVKADKQTVREWEKYSEEVK